jgi:predicted metal-binding membrane protein
MLAAMMLPSVTPMVLAFPRVTKERSPIYGKRPVSAASDR